MNNYRGHFKLLDVPRIRIPAMRMNNLLLNKSQGYGFPLSAETLCRIRLLPGDTDLQRVCPLSFTLGIGNTSAGLWLSDWPLPERIRQFIPEDMLATLPENLGISVVTSALAVLLREVEQGFGLAVSVQSLSAEIDSPLHTLPVSFEMQELRLADKTLINQVTGVLMVDEQLHPYLQERLRLWPSDANEDWEHYQTALRLEVSRTQLTIQDINQLQPADIILLDETRFQQQGMIRVCLDSGACCEAVFTSPQKNALTITTEWNNMADNEPRQALNQIDQVPVLLSFDLGQKTLAFNEVKQLRPGYILELSGMLPEVVQIRSQNRLIGTGELVDIDGRIGVRILNLFGKKTKAGV